MKQSVLLEMQLKEALDREINLKMLNESLMQAMSGLANQDKGKEIHLLNQLHEQELSKLKITLQEKITILEYEHRKKCQEFAQLQKDYNQLKQDYEEREQQYVLSLIRKCLRCVELQYQLSLIIKQNEVEKEGLAHEFTEALSNQKSIFEYKELNCHKQKLKDLTYQLDCECKEKDKLLTIKQQIVLIDQQRSLMQQIADLNRSHHETIIQNNQHQMNNQQREQIQTAKLSQNEQEKLYFKIIMDIQFNYFIISSINLEKQLLDYKEINYKLDSQLKILNQQLLDKETKLQLNKKLNQQKSCIMKKKLQSNVKLQLSNQKMIFKGNSLSQQKILLKKNNNQKPFKLNLLGKRARINFMKMLLVKPTSKKLRMALLNKLSIKKITFPMITILLISQDIKRQIISLLKNTLSQGNIGQIKLQPSTILRSEADSIHFNLTDMLNSTRNIDQQTLSCRQSNDDITYNIDQFNGKIIQTNEDSVAPTQILTDRQLSPRTRIQTVNPKGPISKVRQIQADLSKENTIVRLKS